MIRPQMDVDLTAPPVGEPERMGPEEEHTAASAANADLLRLLQKAAESDASDVHLIPGYAATLRVHGHLEPADEAPMQSDQIKCMAQSILPPALFERFEEIKNSDCSVSFQHAGQHFRFRANVYLAQDAWCVCFRHIPNQIPSLKWLGFPQELANRLVSHKNGLVIVAGETGAGKSSSLAALIELLRDTRDCRVLTIEEPIEYVYQPGGKTVITQREVGRDVDSFADGLKYGLRQDPDVILVGEIRDRETAAMALSAAETGHLILTTMHTRDAKGALTRLVDLFPHDAQEDIRKQVAMSLRSVVSQRLLPSATKGEKRVLALEVLHVNQQVQVAIRNAKIEMIESALQTGVREGMITLDDDLRRLARLGHISVETARRFAQDPEAFSSVGRTW